RQVRVEHGHEPLPADALLAGDGGPDGDVVTALLPDQAARRPRLLPGLPLFTGGLQHSQRGDVTIAEGRGQRGGSKRLLLMTHRCSPSMGQLEVADRPRQPPRLDAREGTPRCWAGLGIRVWIFVPVCRAQLRRWMSHPAPSDSQARTCSTVRRVMRTAWVPHPADWSSMGTTARGSRSLRARWSLTHGG